MSLWSSMLSKFMRKGAEPQILCLHGFTRSGAVFSSQTEHLQAAISSRLGSDVKFHFPNGSIRLNAASEVEGAYAWWRKDDDTNKYVGLEDTFRFLGNYLDFHGPFVGVIGFSQGGCLAPLLASALETGNGRQKPPSLATGHPPMKFAVSFSGFRATRPWHDEFYDPPIETPVLNIIGKEDQLVRPERSEDLVKVCAGGKDRVIYHHGGHWVPRDEDVIQAVVSFVADRVDPHADKDRGKAGSVL